MTPELASFSDWVLALLPRLFLYPGGLWLIAVCLVFRVAGEGMWVLRFRPLLGDLARADLAALATSWAGVALLPLPGLPPLAHAPDRFSLAALPALSLLLDLRRRDHSDGGRVGLLGAVITLAVLVPGIEARSLLAAGEPSAAAWLSVLAVIASVAVLAPGRRAVDATSVRAICWLGLAAWPIWGLLPGEWATLAAAVGLPLAGGVVALASRRFGSLYEEKYGLSRVVLAIPALLVTGALCVALLRQ